MCRSIKRLREGDELATDEEIRAAARQFVRKVSGYRAPSPRNQEAFEAAVEEIAEASKRMLLVVRPHAGRAGAQTPVSAGNGRRLGAQTP